MAWTGDPDEGDIQSLIDITGNCFGRAEAIARLKANQFDISRAANEFYDDTSDGSKYKWDDSVWAADRDGIDNAAGVQFNIQGPDVPSTGHYDTNSAAPTRPPSRTNNRSPMGRLADLTAFQAAGAPTTQADEDADLQRALAESAADSGLPPQESGIIGADLSEKKFGPATRTEYEQDQWAMVPTKLGTTTQQTLELPPSARKRDHAAPAFLRASKEHRLAAIITILTHIPMAKNALLSCGDPAKSYGYSNEWWEGKLIPKQQRLETPAQDDWGTNDQDYPEFHEELHRLIAFLDGTDRAYGSVDGLAVTAAVDPNHGLGWGNVDVEEAFFGALRGEVEETTNAALKSFMSTARTERVSKGSPDESEEDEMVQSADSDSAEDAVFDFLTIPLQEEQSQGVNSLYNALDGIFWRDALSNEAFPTESSTSSFLTETGSIFTIRIGGAGLCKPCDVPVTLYVDRYVESRRDLAVAIQTHIHKLREILARTEEWEKRALMCPGETGCRDRNWFQGEQHSARDCWSKTVELSEALIDRQRRLAQSRYTTEKLAQGITPSMKDIALVHSGDSPYELTQEERSLEETLQGGVEVAKRKLADMDLDVEYIKDKRQQYLEALDHLSMRLTTSESEAPKDFVDKYITPDQPQHYRADHWNPSHKLLLRGVATTNEITYVCTTRAPDLIDVNDGSEPREQWWKLVYAAQEKNPVLIERTDAESVSIAAGSESKHPILIYASEAAIAAGSVQLSDALRTFVRADNKVFQNELSKAEQAPIDYQAIDASQSAAPYGDGPMPLTAEAMETVAQASGVPSSKRKHSAASSIATIDSTDSRALDMSFADPVGPFRDQDDHAPSSWHQEFASPTPQPNKLGGLVESLEKCRTIEPESPTLGRRVTVSQEMMDMGSSFDGADARVPEMQERPGGPSPFMVNRPGETASQVGPSHAINLMDMEMDVDTEHHEG